MLSFFSESFFGDFPSCFCGFSEFYCLSLSSRSVFGDELCFRGWGFVVEFFSEEFTYSFYDDREGGNAARFFCWFLGVFPLQPRGNEILAISGVWIFEFLLELIFQ